MAVKSELVYFLILVFVVLLSADLWYFADYSNVIGGMLCCSSGCYFGPLKECIAANYCSFFKLAQILPLFV